MVMNGMNVGKNMFDLRVSNRVAVLELLYASGGMSRKEIATRLNLTPAAISHIASDMIAEGLLIETKKVEGKSRMGRREIILEIDLTKFRVLCAYIPTRDIHFSCIDLKGNTHFSKALSYEAELTGTEIVEALTYEMSAYLESLPEDERRWVIGVGLGVKGIFDVEHGTSLKSFGLWEDELPIQRLIQKRLGLRVLADNNIRGVASAEMLFAHEEPVHSMLLVKYGPLVGGAFVLGGQLFRGSGYHAMELGHFIVNPLGSVCRCGKRGCLETVVGFDVMACLLQLQFSPSRLPILHRLTGGDRHKISMETIMESFEQGERAVTEMLDGALDHLALMIVNAVGLVDPERVTLYGYPFESERFMALLRGKIVALCHGDVTCEIVKSPRNMGLDDLGCASLVIMDFISNGGIYEPVRMTNEE